MAIARWMAVGVALLAGIADAQEAPALEAEKEKRSYALGMAVGKQLRTQSVDIEPGLYLQGLEDAMSGGKTLLTEAEARAAIHRLHVEQKQRKSSPQPSDRRAAGGVQVSFKMDPRLTKGLYMGDRWVSRATYASASAPEVAPITLKARVGGAGASRPGEPGPSWIASNPEMVAISPLQGDEVTLTVQRSGASAVTVKYRDLSSTFRVETAGAGDRWRVDLSTVPGVPLPAGATAVATPSATDQGR